MSDTLLKTCDQIGIALNDLKVLEDLQHKEKLVDKSDVEKTRLLEISLESTVSKYKSYSLETESDHDNREKYLSERIKKWINNIIQFINKLFTKISQYVIKIKNNKIVFKDKITRRLQYLIKDIKERKEPLRSITISELTNISYTSGKNANEDQLDFISRMNDSVLNYLKTNRITAVRDLTDKIKKGESDLDYHDKKKLRMITLDKWIQPSKKNFIEKLSNKFKDYELISLAPNNHVIIYSSILGENQTLEPGYLFTIRESNIVSGDQKISAKKIQDAVIEAKKLSDLAINLDKLNHELYKLSDVIAYVNATLKRKVSVGNDGRPSIHHAIKLLAHYISNQLSMILKFHSLIENYVKISVDVLYRQADIRYKKD